MVQQALEKLRRMASQAWLRGFMARILAESAREHELAEREFKRDPRKRQAQALKGRLGRRL